jgi:hypothetical protein
VAFRGSNTNNGSGVAPTVTITAGTVQPGDGVLLVLVCDDTVSNINFTSAGFAQLTSGDITLDGERARLFWKQATTTESGSYTGSATPSASWLLGYVTFSGRGNSTPLFSTYAVSNASNTSPVVATANALTAGAGDDLALVAFVDPNASGVVSGAVPGGSFIERIDQHVTFDAMEVATIDNFAGGSTGTATVTFTLTANSAGWGAWIVSFAAGVAAEPAEQPSRPPYSQQPNAPGPRGFVENRQAIFRPALDVTYKPTNHVQRWLHLSNTVANQHSINFASVANRYDAILLNGPTSQPTDFNTIKSTRPACLVGYYTDLMYADDGGGDNTVMTAAECRTNGWLAKVSGVEITNPFGGTTKMVDLGKPDVWPRAVQHIWEKMAAARAAGANSDPDFFFLDDVNGYQGSISASGVPDGYVDYIDWRNRALVPCLNFIANELRNRGLLLNVPNIGDWPNELLDPVATAASGGFAELATNGNGRTAWSSSALTNLVTSANLAASQGWRIVWNTPIVNSTDTQTAFYGFCLANILGESNVMYHSIAPSGDYGWDIELSQHSINLGAPTGSAVISGNLYSRQYTGGKLFANVGSASVTVPDDSSTLTGLTGYLIGFSSTHTITMGQPSETDSNIGAFKSIKTEAFGQTLETDSNIGAFKSIKNKLFGQTLETDSNTGAFVHRKIRTLLQPSETDSNIGAFKVIKNKLFGQTLETDTSQPMTGFRAHIVHQVLETDSITAAFVSRKIRSFLQTLETDTSQAMRAQHARTVNQTLESDTALGPYVRRKIKVFGQTLESDSNIGAFKVIKTKLLGQPSEADSTTGAFLIRKLRTFGQISESDLAQTFTRIKRKLLGQPAETDSNIGPFVGFTAHFIGQTLETDTSQTFADKIKIKVFLQTLETDTALGPYVRRKIRILGQPLESDITQPVRPKQHVTMVTESDLVFALSRIKRKTLAQPLETDSVTAPFSRRKIGTLHLPQESDLAQIFGRIKRKSLGQPSATNLAQSIHPYFFAIVNQTNELDSVFPITTVGIQLPYSSYELRQHIRGAAQARIRSGSSGKIRGGS